MAKTKYYAVLKGRRPGIFYTWEDCKAQVDGYNGAKYKSFPTVEEAMAYMRKDAQATLNLQAQREEKARTAAVKKASAAAKTAKKKVLLELPDLPPVVHFPVDLIFYTDGSCLVNPKGPGGHAAVIFDNDMQMLQIVTGGEPSTTNNRMELKALIMGLKAVDDGTVHNIMVNTDSQYLQNAFTKYWLRNWKRNNWVKSDGHPVLNQDLWQELDILVGRHRVSFNWVKGHAGQEYNELCDQLAKGEAQKF